MSPVRQFPASRWRRSNRGRNTQSRGFSLARLSRRAQVDGWAAENCTAGEALTLYKSVNFNYSANLLVPGTSYYVSGTVAGGIADAASTGGTVAVARSIDGYRLFVKTSY